MTIKHLVISGGGPSMIQTLGAIQYLETTEFIHTKNIESIYGTSAGAIVGVLIALKYDWVTINDYIIKRPWKDVFAIKAQNIFDAYTKKGLFDIKTIEKCFKPLLDAKDLSMNITLGEFFNYSNIELHFFAFEINNFVLVDVSHLTHPDLPLLVALQMTCGLPVLLTPAFIEDKCYADGGIICNYSLKYCVESGKKEEEILGFKNNYIKNESFITSESTIIDYLLSFLFKLIGNVNQDHIQPPIKNEVVFNIHFLSMDIFNKALSDIHVREDLFKSGESYAKEFLDNIKKIE
jgi:predicted acylesterase/phospholipase RssA